MKMNKLTKLFLSTLVLTSLASCGLKVETNYYEPSIESKYESISKDDFISRFDEAKKKEIKYEYVSAKISFSEPVDFNGYKRSEIYMTGKVDYEGLKANDEWIKQYATSFAGGRNFEIYNNSMYAIRACYQFNNVNNTTASPYSCENSFPGFPAKYVFSNDFLLKSISFTHNNNSVNIDVKYFNKSDLPNAKGEISKETFLNIAYVSNYDPILKNKVELEYSGKNIVVSREENYDPIYDMYITNLIYGDAKLKVSYEINTDSVQNGRGFCFWITKGNEVLEGEMDLKSRYDVLSRIEGGFPKYPLNSLVLDEATIAYAYGEEYTIRYSNSPLSVSIKSIKKETYVEYSNDGLIVKYEEKNKEKNSEHTYTFIYK